MLISGFAGIGKTTLAEKGYKVLDLESSLYQWLDPEIGQQNPAWPHNYISEINSALNKGNNDFILIAMQPEVREMLQHYRIPYYVCFPSKESKQEYMNRYRERGNSQEFIDNLDKNFDNWIDDLTANEENQLVMLPGEFLEDTLKRYNML